MKKYFLLSFLVFSILNIRSQPNGFIGKRNYAEVSFSTHIPFFAGIAQNPYFLFDYPSEKNPFGLFNYSFYGNLGRVIRDNKGIAIEASWDLQSISSLENWTENWPEKFSDIQVNCYSLIPKYEISSKNNLLPVGLTHSLGVGVLNLKYRYENVNENFFLEESVKGVTFLYAIQMRTALSENLLLTYGTRYTVSLLNGGPVWRELYFSDSQLKGIHLLAMYQKKYNFLSAQLGLTYVF
jgi:hypothetical protein